MNRKILIDARRRLNSGIGRLTQWLVNNITETVLENTEIWYLATRNTEGDYDLNQDKTITTEITPCTIDDIYELPSLVMNMKFDLYINPQINTSPFIIAPSINIIHDCWALEYENLAPSRADCVQRFGHEGVESPLFAMTKWLTENRAKKYMTSYGFSLWEKTLSRKDLVSNYAWAQYCAISAYTSHICFVSTVTQKHFFRLFKRTCDTSVIPNSIDKRWWNIDRKKPKLFLVLAKLEKRKNIHMILEAYEIYSRECKTEPLMLYIVGDPGYENYAKIVLKKIEKLSNEGHKIVHLASVKDELIEDLLADAVALLFPSIIEGFGYPPLEAMAAGIPVICSKTGIIATQLGEYATLLTQNTAQELAFHMKNVTEKPVKYEKLAKSAKVLLKDFVNNERVIEKWIKLTTTLLDSSF